MVELQIKFDRNSASELLKRLAAFLGYAQRIEIAVDEASERFPIGASELQLGDELVERYPGGCVLYGGQGEFHLSWPETGVGSLFALLMDDEAMHAVVNGIADVDLHYGFACRPAEHRLRNLIESTKSYGVEEAWVGRAYRSALPGAYWINIIPESLLGELGLSVNQFDSIAQSMKLVGGRNYVIQLYQASDQWLDHAADIDAWCESTNGVFYRLEAIADLERSHTFQEASEALKHWR
tara:strand:- start:127 stop:840 length:714 start_codon:yes stop_codon:yes gene_type:complete